MKNKAKIREEARKLNPIDNPMFMQMAEDKAFCQEILRVILNDPELIVLETVSQYAATNRQGRSATLDAKCRLGDGRIVGVEVQKADDDDHQKRVRYNGALPDHISDEAPPKADRGRRQIHDRNLEEDDG